MRTTDLVLQFVAAFSLAAVISCEELDNDINSHSEGDEPFVAVEDVAKILSVLPLEKEHLKEVFDAVSSSSDNGYDDEYTMKDLFSSPGAGVGDSFSALRNKSGNEMYERPLRDLIGEHLLSRHEFQLKSGAVIPGTSVSAESYLAALQSSDIQIYWPFVENWDGEKFPIITFDPSDGSETNIGYRLALDGNGVRTVEEVLVDENMARNNPVWIINRNDDAEYTSLEILRRQDPDWGSGGSVIVRPKSGSLHGKNGYPFSGKANGNSNVRTLVLKDIVLKRNFDSWFSGASELFVKIGSVEDFVASTEAELKLYTPAVTDFMIVVKRNMVGATIPFNAVLVSDWTDQLEQCAFMITEDDGGTRTSWKCSAVVKVASKSYGFEVNLPFNTRDDIVWRGKLSRRYIERNDNVTGHFGDVDLTFEILDY